MPPRRARPTQESIESEVRGHNVEDMAAVYDAPFPIYSEEEGERYRDLQSKTIEVPTYFDFELLDQIGLKDRFMNLCSRGGWQNFVGMSWPVYRDLTLEFFTSLRFVTRRPNKLWFRVRGRLWYLDERELRHVCGFAENDCEDAHQGFNVTSYWKYLTGLDAYDPHIASNAQIVQAELKLLHKFICGSVFGKKQSTKCSTKELFLLWCIEHGHKPNMFTYVSRTLIELVGRRGNSLGMGYLATAIAQSLRLDLTDVEMLNYHYFDVAYLTRCEIIHGTTRQLRDPSTRKALRRRMAAEESSSIGHRVEYGHNVHGVEYGSETVGQQPQSQHQFAQQHSHQQQSQPDLATIHQLLLDNHNRTQEQLGAITEQMHSIKQQMVNMNSRMVDIEGELEYMVNKWEKAWQVQGLNVPSPTSSSGGNQQKDATDTADGACS